MIGFLVDRCVPRSRAEKTPVLTDRGIIEYYDYKDAKNQDDNKIGDWIQEMGASKAWKLIK